MPSWSSADVTHIYSRNWKIQQWFTPGLQQHYRLGVFWMWHACPCWAAAMFNIWSRGGRGVVRGKQTGSHFLSQWLIWEKRGSGEGGTESEVGVARTKQEAQAVDEQGCRVGLSRVGSGKKCWYQERSIGIGICQCYDRACARFIDDARVEVTQGQVKEILGGFGSLLSNWLTNVEVALSLPAVLEVMDKRMANLTLWAKVQHQSEEKNLHLWPQSLRLRLTLPSLGTQDLFFSAWRHSSQSTLIQILLVSLKVLLGMLMRANRVQFT